MAKKERKAPHVPKDEAVRLMDIAMRAAARFSGDFGELESAIGMLVIGKQVGWRVLVLIHNKRTIKKYEEILGIKVREEFPAEGELTDKSLGYKLVKQLNAFWEAVSGEHKVEDRRTLT